MEFSQFAWKLEVISDLGLILGKASQLQVCTVGYLHNRDFICLFIYLFIHQ